MVFTIGNIITLVITSYRMGPDYFNKKNPKKKTSKIQYKNGKYYLLGKYPATGTAHKNNLMLYFDNDEYGGYNSFKLK